MSNVSISITGVSELTRKFGKLGSIDIFRRPMQRSVMRLQRDMAQYPTKKPGSSYIRQGTLGRRWTTAVQQSAHGMTGKVGNNTSYGPFVQSSQFQANVHQGRWQTDEDVLERNRTDIMADFNATVAKVIA